MTEQTGNIDDQLLNQGLEDDAGGAGEQGKDPAKAGAGDTLELGGEEAPELTDEQKAEEQRKGRSQRWEKRVDNLTARLREAERRVAEAEARGKPETVEAPKAPDPNDAKYEFGEADPQYIRDAAVFEVKSELAKERDAAAKADGENAAKAEVVGKINEGMAAVEKAGSEKYDDFADKIAEAVEARGGESLHPLIGIGIAVSPAGADIAYRLATDEAASDKIEKLAATNPQAAAVAFGEIEGEFVDDDGDLNLGDPLDMARMLGRMKARLAGKSGAGSKAAEVRTTKAPKPAEHRARSGSGQFEVGDDTDDFGAFEAKHMKKGR